MRVKRANSVYSSAMTEHVPFIGSCRAAHAAGAFRFGQWVASGRREVAAHGHAEPHFMYVPLGDYVTDAEGPRPRDGSNLVFNPAGTYHRDRMTGPGTFFSLSISDTAEAMDRLPHTPHSIVNGAAHRLLGALARECVNWRADSAVRAESLCLELLGAASAPMPRERQRPRWLDAAAAMFEDGDASVAVVARAVGVHPVHLARTFRVYFGCTPGDYARRQRCRRAAYLLSRTRRPVADIALAIGFADQSHFTKAFHRAVGVPPAEFRRLTVN